MDVAAGVLHEFRGALRGFLADRVAPRVTSGEAERAVPDDLVRELGKLGYLAVGLPADRGGEGMGGELVLVEELARAWGSLALKAVTTALLPARLASEVPDGWERWGQAAAEGTLATGLPLFDYVGNARVLRAVRTAGQLRVSGDLRYVINGGRAELLLMSVSEEDRPASETFVIRRGAPGWAVTKRHDMDGFRAVDVVDVRFDEIAIGPEDRLGADELAIAARTSARAVLVAALSVGLAQGAHDLAIRYGGERRQFGRPIGTFGELYRMLADSESEIAAGRALAMRAAADWDAGDRSGRTARSAKLFCSQMSVRVTERAQHIHGGYGLMAEFPVGRYARDARMCPALGGPADLDARDIARSLGVPLSERPTGVPIGRGDAGVRS